MNLPVLDSPRQPSTKLPITQFSCGLNTPRHAWPFALTAFSAERQPASGIKTQCELSIELLKLNALTRYGFPLGKCDVRSCQALSAR